MKVAALLVAIAMGALSVGCAGGQSSTDTSPSSKTKVDIAQPPISSGCSTTLASLGRWVRRFERSVAGPDPAALSRLMQGRFKWLSITGWPAGGDSNFAGRSPRKAIAYIKKKRGLPIRIERVAVSRNMHRPRVGFYYWGSVQTASRNRAWFIGKAALNCDGTLRVWSMAVRDREIHPPDPCPPRNVSIVDGFQSCRREGVTLLSRS